MRGATLKNSVIITMFDTIVATATANGVGAISIVRVSGKDALKLSLKLLRLQNLRPREAKFTKIYSINNELIDEGIIIYFKSPNSFTGEDIVEFQTHGGFSVSNLVIENLINLGARVAQPGEFSKRAFLNSKMSLSKAETIQALINSRSNDSHKILARQLEGELGKFVNELRSELVKTLAYIETCIDYADDDLPSDILLDTDKMLDENIQKLENITTVSEQRKGLIDGFKVAIIGKPNVGKSSLLNAMLKKDRAIISDEAGTTRDTIEETLLVGTHLVRIIDTAGIRDGRSNVESLGIQHSLRVAKEADIIIAVFDSSRKQDEEDDKILEILENSDKKVIKVINKSDLDRELTSDISGIEISTKTSLKPLFNELKSYLDSQNYDGVMLITTRQITATKNALEALKRAKFQLKDGVLELFAYEINLAITEISSITRPFERSEILDEMFSSFCLGK